VLGYLISYGKFRVQCMMVGHDDSRRHGAGFCRLGEHPLRTSPREGGGGYHNGDRGRGSKL